MDVVAGQDEGRRAAAQNAWQTVAGLGVGTGSVQVVREVNELPRSAKLFTGEDGLREVIRRLAQNHGIDEATVGERIHAIKGAEGIANDADLVFDATGNVYHSVTGELLGSLTTGGAR